MINKALLYKSYKVTVPFDKAAPYNREVLPDLTRLVDFLSEHGFGLSEELAKAFFRLDKKPFEEAAKELVDLLSGMSVDIVRDAKTFYNNFPADPLSLTPAERAGYQIAYYFFGDVIRSFLPEDDGSTRGLKPLRNRDRTLELGTDGDVVKLYSRLMVSPVSVSEQDRGFLQEAFEAKDPLVLRAIREAMPNKENMAFVSVRMMENFPEVFYEKCGGYFKTATDVLRFIWVLNGYSAAMSEDEWKLKPLSRKIRRFVFGLLDRCSSLEEDMRRNEYQWKSVAYKYHPFEFLKTEKARQAFDRLYKEDLERSFSAKVEAAMENKDLQQALQLLSARPGEFARRLDHLMNVFQRDGIRVIEAFEAIPADRFEPKLLLQLMAHFKARTEWREYALYLPKGGEAGIYVKADDRLPISAYAAERICQACEEKILAVYAAKPALGKVYIDESVKGYKVPLQMRASGKAGIRVPAKGSRIRSDPDKDIVRTFIWWTNEESGRRVDVDLSLRMYNEKLENTGMYFYGNFYSDTEDGKVSSGDITDGGRFGGKGAAEFLDFSRSKMIEEGHRYIQVCVNVYSANNFNTFPCRFGFMQRDKINENVKFEPSTVEGTIDISSETSNYSPVVYDLEKGEFIWVDVTGMGRNARLLNVLGQAVSFNAALYMAVHNEIPELYDLILLNARARGEITENREEADVVYSLKEGITPYDLDVISADLLAKEVQEVKTEGGEDGVEESGEGRRKETAGTGGDNRAAGAVSAETGDVRGTRSSEETPDEAFLRFLIQA